MNRRSFTAAMTALLLSTGQIPAMAADGMMHHGATATHGPLSIETIRVRASIGRAPNSAAYLTVTTSGAADRLISAASPAAERVEIHRSFMEDGVMKMAPVDGVPVAADSPAELKPGGNHIMLIGLVEPLKEGSEIDLTLTFEKAGAVTVKAPVVRIRGHGH